MQKNLLERRYMIIFIYFFGNRKQEEWMWVEDVIGPGMTLKCYSLFVSSL